MDNWIDEVISLPGQWLNIAAGKALLNLKQSQDRSIDGMLAGYHLSLKLLDKVFSNFASQKHTLSEQDEEDLELAIKLMKVSVSSEHPLYKRFIEDASVMKPELEGGL